MTTDMNADASYCLVLDAARVAGGPDGRELRRWRTTDDPADAVGL